jgi:hypothetical protein
VRDLKLTHLFAIADQVSPRHHGGESGYVQIRPGTAALEKIEVS